MPANQLLERLAAVYLATEIRHPGLRAVTLAQWMLESGRATSGLAVEHNNFGGLKWREEMAPFATKVRFNAHDGEDDYCKFATIDDFCKGYWAFIGRSPYAGFEQHVHSPEAYVGFIGPIYAPAAPDYAEKVLRLVPEAEQLLAETAAAGPEPVAPAATRLGTIVIDPGHGGTSNLPGSSHNNATSVSGVKEKQLTLEFAMLLRDQLTRQAAAAGEEIKVVLTRESDKNVPGADRARMALDNRASAFLSIHFNGFNNPATRGCETFFGAAANGNLNLEDDKRFAKIVNDAVFSALAAIDSGAKNRDVKPDTDTGPQKLAVLSDINLGNSQRPSDKCCAVLLEIEFITNPQVDQLLISGPDASANRMTVMASVATAIRAHLGSTAQPVVQPVAEPVGEPLDLLAGLGSKGAAAGGERAGGQPG